ncbi:MAG: M23 family metallopeptidase [Chloroflexi bacterium]|nr:MAG: M23 family metallopeptidase [Chloroflexota bacterium]
MKRILLILILAVGLQIQAQDSTPSPTSTPSPAPTQVTAPTERPPAVTTISQDGVTLELYFDTLKQGRVGVLHLTGDDISEARLRFINQESWFFPVEDEGWYALLAVDMDQNPRNNYELTVIVGRADAPPLTLTATFGVELGGFIRESINVPQDRAYLIDPEIERLEFARMNAVFETYTQEKLWDGFQYPINSVLTSPFGVFRTFNGTVETRHTGWDLRATTGTPVMAMASGRVAFAGLLDIRGNHIIIDHGYGVYSGYSHLSQVHVTTGQTVRAGQIIGVSGNTGRSGGAHLHWELAVNGLWVDVRDFMATWLP